MTRRLLAPRIVLLALLGVPALAQAHLVSTGLGPFYDGVSHLLYAPEDLLPALALALYGGLRGPASARGVVFGLPGAWLAAGLAGLAWPWAPLPGAVAAGCMVVTGGLVALDLGLASVGVATLGVVLGAVLGFGNGAAFAESRLGVLGLLGTIATLFVVVALVAAGAVALRQGWKRVLVRVAGSWIAAAGLLLLGWSLRTP